MDEEMVDEIILFRNDAKREAKCEVRGISSRRLD
jgi:hypothetical protein